ncbi:hypothetical protein SD71_06640 [Cohnella kolymensis]|uniref:Copper amine oxidase-like N-terminal domain-containing protein n=1 Tax=Cohnella kolymensis TaxID=1590652 RepID=A0ABR5A6Y5_9BACL|nr:hypothetical protein SD71_06640 [Cohnella kolymensis]
MGLISLVIVIATVGVNNVVEADTNSPPGSTDDPIVTKSYVDRKIAEATGVGPVGGGAGAGESSKLQVVTVPLGKKIVVQDGGELIVRSGKAVAYSTDANGLSDMTDGLDIAPGKPVGTNHLILFPRGGRGVQADPKQKFGLIVLVRGNYQIQ